MTRAAVRLVVVSALATAAVATSVIVARAQRPATSAGATARLAGRIVDAGDPRQPIRRAIVTITGDLIPAGRSVISDDDGRFAFARVPAGVVTLTATRAGFVRATYGAVRPGRPGTPIAISAGVDVVDLVMPMAHGAALDGTLRDIAGDPAPGMRIEAIRVIQRADGARGETAAAVLTDDRGGFRIFGLPAGEYVLVATPSMIVAGIGDIGAPSEAEVDALLASLPRKAPAPAAPGTPAPATAPTPTSPVKSYSTPPIYYPGVLQSGDATRITLGANEERTGLDFATRLSHSAAIDGVIAPVPGGTVPQVTIAIRGAEVDLPVFGGGASGPSLSMRPAEHTFHISNVPPGRYRLTARTIGGPGNSTQVISSGGALPRPDASASVQWAVTDVTVGGDDLTNVTLALQPALRVSGRIAFDVTTLAAPADPSALRLALEPLAAGDMGSIGLTTALPATIGRDGAFEFPQVIPGSYRLTASLPGAGSSGGLWLRSALLDTRDVLDGGLRVGVTDVAGLAVTFADRHSGITGTLSSRAGQAAPAYVIVAFSTDRAMWRAPSRRVRSTRPATDGAFELLDLPPGSYYLAALTDVDPSDLDDATFLDALVSSAVTVSFAEGERKRQDFRIGGL